MQKRSDAKAEKKDIVKSAIGSNGVLKETSTDRSALAVIEYLKHTSNTPSRV